MPFVYAALTHVQLSAFGAQRMLMSRWFGTDADAVRIRSIEQEQLPAATRVSVLRSHGSKQCA